MCPFCLTTLAVTVASSAGASGGAVALALRIRRLLAKNPKREPREHGHESVTPLHANHDDIS